MGMNIYIFKSAMHVNFRLTRMQNQQLVTLSLALRRNILRFNKDDIYVSSYLFSNDNPLKVEEDSNTFIFYISIILHFLIC